MGFDQYRWEQIPVSIESETLVASVGSTASGWVAVGFRINLPSAGASFAPGDDPFAHFYSGVVWTSPDGRSWTRHADGDVFDGASMLNVLGYGSGAIAFGRGGVCLPDACSGLPPNGGTIVWSSSDGQTWERLSNTALAEGATTDVTRVGGGLVAVGYVANDGSKPDTDSFSNPTDAAVWRSGDGRHWTAVLDLPAADRLSSVSAQGSDLIALGSSGGATVAWISSDGGLTWIQAPELADDCCSISALRDDRAVVAASSDVGDQIGAIVSAIDSTSHTWTRQTPPTMRDFRPVSAQVLGRSFVIFGWTVHRDPDEFIVDDQPVAFSSVDGFGWVQAILPEAWKGQSPVSVATRANNLVAIVGPLATLNGPPESLTQTLWFGTASN